MGFTFQSHSTFTLALYVISSYKYGTQLNGPQYSTNATIRRQAVDLNVESSKPMITEEV